KKITVDVRGEILELKDTINTMVDHLRSFAAEVTRVAREVATEGKLGGQADAQIGERCSDTNLALDDHRQALANKLSVAIKEQVAANPRSRQNVRAQAEEARSRYRPLTQGDSERIKQNRRASRRPGRALNEKTFWRLTQAILFFLDFDRGVVVKWQIQNKVSRSVDQVYGGRFV